MPVILETDRLVLRPFAPRDRAPFAALNADPKVMRHFPKPLSRRESDAMIDLAEARRLEDGFCFSAVEERATGAFLGMVGLSRPRFEAHFVPCVEIGWRLAVAAQGRGVAAEAAAAWLAHAFAPEAEGGLGLPQVVAFTTVANAPSRALMERLGMTRDPADDFDHPALPEGHPLRRHVLHRACAASPPAR